MDRPLTTRGRAVLDALLSVQFEGVARLREQAATVRVVGRCECGCPSIDFKSGQSSGGMHVQVNAGIRGSSDGLFLYTVGGDLGGIEWVSGGGVDPAELPEPSQLEITPA